MSAVSGLKGGRSIDYASVVSSGSNITISSAFSAKSPRQQSDTPRRGNLTPISWSQNRSPSQKSFAEVAIRINEVTQDLFICHMTPTDEFTTNRPLRPKPLSPIEWSEQETGIELDEESVLRTAYDLYRV